MGAVARPNAPTAPLLAVKFDVFAQAPARRRTTCPEIRFVYSPADVS